MVYKRNLIVHARITIGGRNSANCGIMYATRWTTESKRDSLSLPVWQSGGWAAFEVKLGIGIHDEAANNLLKLNEIIDTTKFTKTASLNIITGTELSYTPDGVNMISIASLGK